MAVHTRMTLLCINVYATLLVITMVLTTAVFCKESSSHHLRKRSEKTVSCECESESTLLTCADKSTVPLDLMRLSQSGSLCIHDDAPPVLQSCATGDGVDECDCVKTENNDAVMIICSCGECSLRFNVDAKADQDEFMVLPSKFECSCSREEINFAIKVKDGYCMLQAERQAVRQRRDDDEEDGEEEDDDDEEEDDDGSDDDATGGGGVGGGGGGGDEGVNTISIDISSTDHRTTKEMMTESSTVVDTSKLAVTDNSNTDHQTTIELLTESSTDDTNKLATTNTAPPTTVNVGLATENRPTSSTEENRGQIGIAVGATLAAIFILVALVACLVGKRKRKKSEGTNESLVIHTQGLGSTTIEVNPTFGLYEDGSASNTILTTVTEGDALAVRNPMYEDVPEEPKICDEYSYMKLPENCSTIPSTGYESVDPTQHKNADSTLQGTKNSNEEVSSQSYTPFPHNEGSSYATIPYLEDCTYEEMPPGNQSIAPPTPREQAQGSCGYVSVDGPPNQEHDDSGHNYPEDYYFKLQKPVPDATGRSVSHLNEKLSLDDRKYQSISMSTSPPPTGDELAYDTLNRNAAGKNEALEDGAYDTFNRTSGEIHTEAARLHTAAIRFFEA